MIDLQRSLDIILEETHPSGSEPYGLASGLVQQLQDARQKVLDIEHKLSTIKRKISADLAIDLRRTQPSLNVALDKTGCKVGYKTKMLHFTPDIENAIWRVTSSNQRFLREFLNAHRKSTLIGDDLSVLVNAIVSYFTAYYRTLHENLTGTGLLFVEDKKGSLFELVAWRDESRPSPIKSRRLHG